MTFLLILAKNSIKALFVAAFGYLVILVLTSILMIPVAIVAGGDIATSVIDAMSSVVIYKIVYSIALVTMTVKDLS